MPIKQDEGEKLRQFLGNILEGVADLSYKAMPIVSLYKRAQVEKVDFWELLLTDDAASTVLAKALEKHAAKLPPAVIASMRLVVNARQQHDIRKKQEADALAAARSKAREPASTPVGGNRVDEDV